MKRLMLLIITLIVVSSICPLSIDAQSAWRETNRTINVPSLVDPTTTDGIEIYGIGGAIVVRTNHRIQVRVFTILGQLVTQATLPPGTNEFKVAARGIYIVKIGNITQKVAL